MGVRSLPVAGLALVPHKSSKWLEAELLGVVDCLLTLVRLCVGVIRGAGVVSGAEGDRLGPQMRGYWRLLS